MLDFLTTQFTNGPTIHPLDIAIRLLTALAFGWAIAWVYQRTRKAPDSSFTGTILLLCVLIAMVTQVIGDNVARAFSLVGALSIVRFRTVVRDTQDTAYVILSVIVGMAVGAKALWVAVIGIAIVGVAELLLNLRRASLLQPDAEYTLRLKVASNQNLEELLQKAIRDQIKSKELISVGTGKRGALVEAAYRLRLIEGNSAFDLVSRLDAIEGVESVQLINRSFDDE